MRGAPVLIAAVIGAMAAMAGCAQQHPGTSGATPGPAPSASPPAAAVCPGGRPAAHASKITITAADNYESFCVTRGTTVTVFLKGTVARRWAPVHATSGALMPHANGELTLPVGVTGASFVAARPGTAVITSSRPACGPGVPPGDGATGTGTLSCDAIIAFRVAVTVIR